MTCDRWWEPETEWHRAWKNNFPREWQEAIQHDVQSGEKHIADVRTKHGLVIEFQHSHLDPRERAARERFYRNMAWVVDGTRLTRDYPRFLKGMDKRRKVADGWFLVDDPQDCFPTDWLESSMLVFFDFRGMDPGSPLDTIRERLWCLLPIRAGRYAVVAAISRGHFLEEASNAPHLLQGHAELVNELTGLIQQKQAQRQRVYVAPATRQQRYYRRSAKTWRKPTRM